MRSPNSDLDCVEIPVGRLALGMYVAELDRPWLGTPFLFQGFYIDSAEELRLLRDICRSVRVDRARTDPSLLPTATTDADIAANCMPPNTIFKNVRASRICTRCTMPEELSRARAVHGDLVDVVAEAMEELRRGRVVDVDRLKSACGPLIDSVDANPDALMWLASIRKKDDHMYRQSIAAAILAVTYGRHLGLPRHALSDLAVGGLLFDVGKTKIPDDVLLKPDRLSDAEFAVYKTHVSEGLAILGRCHGVNQAVLAMVRTHHERHDGSGYDLGLRDDAIPAFGKIAGIVDAYETMVTAAANTERHSAHDALSYLARRRGREFDAALVEEFIQAIGIYPTGSIVRLSDGRIGLIIEQNRMRRLQPKIMVVMDAGHQLLPAFETVDLLTASEGPDGRPLTVVDCLEAGAYGITAEDYYL